MYQAGGKSASAAKNLLITFEFVVESELSVCRTLAIWSMADDKLQPQRYSTAGARRARELPARKEDSENTQTTI